MKAEPTEKYRQKKAPAQTAFIKIYGNVKYVIDVFNGAF